jgi:ABC-type sugar transport system permease subunit
VLCPIIANFILSLLSWDIITPPKFVGLSNYINMIRDVFLWKYAGNTLFFLFVQGGFTFLLVMFIVCLTSKTSQKFQAGMRLVFLIPAAAAFPVVYALIWRWLYNPDFGLINTLLAKIGIDGPDWLSSKTWAKPAMAIYHICSYSGFWICLGLIVFTGWYNAKTSNKGERYFLSPLFRFAIPMLASFIFLFPVMGSAYVMTGGGPAGATTTFGYYIYNNAFQWFKFGYASALSVIQLLVPVLLGLLVWYMVNKYKIQCVLEPLSKNSTANCGCSKKNFLILLTIVILLPWLVSILWAFSTSLKPPGEVFTFPPVWISKNLTWNNYARAWTSAPYSKFLLSTIYVSVVTALLQMVIIFFGAYSLSVLKPFGNKASNLIFFLIGITIFMPFHIISIPVFVTVKTMSWIGTYKALIIPKIAWPMGFFLMKIYFDGLEPEISKKKEIGYSDGRIFKEIILTRGLSWAGMLTAVSIFQNWQEFGLPLMTSFQGLYVTDWSILMAGAVMILGVTMVIFLPLFILCERKVWSKVRLVTK